MTDPQSAMANQIRNIEAKTGKSFQDLCRLIAESGLRKVGEQRSMLSERLGLGYGDANMVALKAKEAVTPEPAAADPLDAVHGGALTAAARLKAVPAGGMRQYTVRLCSPSEIDDELMAWVCVAF
jgi:L-fucose isomerase-like protein